MQTTHRMIGWLAAFLVLALLDYFRRIGGTLRTHSSAAPVTLTFAERGPVKAPQSHHALAALKDRFRSGFDCIGEEYADAHCVLHNVCVVGRTIRYYRPKEAAGGVAGHLGDGPATPPAKLCAASSCERNGYLDIEVVPEAAPPSVTFAQGSHFLIYRYLEGNWGHVLGDEVFAVFQSMKLWGLTDQEPRIVTDKLSPSLRLFEFITKAKPTTVGNDPASMQCFDRLVTGWAHLGYVGRRLILPGSILNEFRDHVMAHLGIAPRKQPRTLTFTILEKDLRAAEHNSIIADAEAFEDRLRQQYPDALVQRVRWTGMEVSKQVQVMRDTDVLISLPGSDAMNCVFLPPVSAIIMPLRKLDGRWDASIDIAIWFRWVPQIFIREPDLRLNELAQVENGIELGGFIDDDVRDAVRYLCSRSVLAPVHCKA